MQHPGKRLGRQKKVVVSSESAENQSWFAMELDCRRCRAPLRQRLEAPQKAWWLPSLQLKSGPLRPDYQTCSSTTPSYSITTSPSGPTKLRFFAYDTADATLKTLGSAESPCYKIYAVDSEASLRPVCHLGQQLGCFAGVVLDILPCLMLLDGYGHDLL